MGPVSPAFWTPPPDGVVAQRRPISAVRSEAESGVTALLGRAAAYLLTGTRAFDGWARDCPVAVLCGAR